MAEFFEDKEADAAFEGYEEPEIPALLQRISFRPAGLMEGPEFAFQVTPPAHRAWKHDEIVNGLKELRKRFPPAKIGKKPQPFKNQTHEGDCDVCGRWHKGANGFHVDYVGHANVMDRLDAVDPFWVLEVRCGADGQPIRVGGAIIGDLSMFGGAITRTEAGEGKTLKTALSDLLKRCAMRFGVARDLWDKDDGGWDEETTAAAQAGTAAQAPAQANGGQQAQQPAQQARGQGRAQQAPQTPEDRVRVSIVNRLNRMSTEDRKALRTFMSSEGRNTSAEKWTMADMERVNEWMQGDIQPPTEQPDPPLPAEEEPF